jgi:hypothetical protein
MRDGRADLVHSTRDVARLTSRDLAEPMLCDGCEQKLAVAERYVASISVQSDGQFPARDQVAIVAGVQSAGTASASALDVNLLAHFAVGIVWRASASKFLAGKVNLGPFGGLAKEYLLGHTRFPLSRAAVLVELVSPPKGAPVDRILLAPYRTKIGRSPSHRFALAGLVFHTSFGSHLDELLTSRCIVRSGTVTLSDGIHLYDAVAPMFSGAQRKGKLRTRRDDA